MMDSYQEMFLSSKENWYQDLIENRIAYDLKLIDILENFPDGLVSFDQNFRIIYANIFFEEISFISRENIIGGNILDFFAPYHLKIPGLRFKIDMLMLEGIPFDMVIEDDLRKRKSYYFIRCYQKKTSEGSRQEFNLIIQDITKNKIYENKLYQLAFFDSLTGVANRSSFYSKLAREISFAERKSARFGVLLIGLDSFKKINDIYGHSAGDDLLGLTAMRIQALLDEKATIARMSGDEFSIILPDIKGKWNLVELATRILAQVKKPFKINGNNVNITASIGIVGYPSDDKSLPQLLKMADSAMHHAKKNGGDNFRFFSRTLMQELNRRQLIEEELKYALERGEFQLEFQPQFDLKTKKIYGAESLLRWKSAKLGAVAPSRFIALAEGSGRIEEIGKWVLKRACQTARQWNEKRSEAIRIAVNISTRQFLAADFADVVKYTLEKTNCRPEWIELEITESLLMDSGRMVLNTLETLRKMNVKIAIDDFGVGYSALAYLKKFPLDVVKIDKLFIEDITENPRSLELIRAIVSMAQNLNLRIVAEGVENADQANLLMQTRCDLGQGFLFGKPMPESEFYHKYLK